MVESGLADFVVTTWFGVLAPAGTPDSIVRRLNAAVVDILGDAAVKDRLDRSGLIAAPSTPAQFTGLIKSELVRWKKVIDDTGSKPE